MWVFDKLLHKHKTVSEADKSPVFRETPLKESFHEEVTHRQFNLPNGDTIEMEEEFYESYKRL